jgi:uncharacterized protein YbbC (DUF1343 family)
VKRAAFLAGTAASLGAPVLAGAAQPSPKVTLGDDLFLRETWRELRGRAVGIVTNPSGVLSSGQALVDAVHANPEISVKALFGPEHGIRGIATAGSSVASSIDARTGLPVYSLYGATRHPSAAMLEGIDVILFDIQDVGARPYTYVSTMAYVMESAAQYGKEVWVLDRPNPTGGILVDGPILEPKFKSFIGLYPIPERHGMTVGELARMFNEHFGIGAKLRVIPMQGWSREMVWADTGLNWIPTSPNIPYALTALVYLATGLIDEAGVNNGIHTARPFEYAGGWQYDAQAYAEALNARAIPGVHFEPQTWAPRGGFWAGKTLSGAWLNITDPHAFPNVRTAVEILAAARAQGKLHIANQAHMDRDWGTSTVRTALLEGESPDAIVAAWEPGLRAFRSLRRTYLLY